MSHIHIRRDHALSAKKARAAAEHVAEELSAEFSMAHEWEENVLHFSRPGVQGNLTLHPKTVEIKVKLGLLLLAMRSRIESEIHRYFDENFPPPRKPKA